MKFTGERYIPNGDMISDISVEHISRYEAVAAIVKNKKVLDIASGEGYGSFILSQEAHSVIGIDISLEAIEHAKSKYECENLSFTVGDVSDIPISAGSIDVVISFETIEHVDEEKQHLFLNEIKRVLKSDGILIMSTPDTIIYNELIDNYSNSYHIKEFNKEEYKIFMSQYFKYCLYYDQDFQIANVIAHENVTNFRSIDLAENKSLRGKYLIAMCSDETLPNTNIDIITFYGATRYRDTQKRIIELQEQVETTSQHIKKMFNDITERDATIMDLNQQIEQVDKNILEMKVNMMSQLQSEINNLNCQIRKMYDDIIERDNQIFHFQNEIRDYADKHQIDKENAKCLIAQLEGEKEASEYEIAALREEKETLEYKNEELMHEIEQFRQDIHQIEERLDIERQNMAERERIQSSEKNQFLAQIKSLENDNKQLAENCLCFQNQLSEKQNELMAFSDWGSKNQKKLEQVLEDYRKLSFELSLIKNSDFWKLATKYYKIRDNVWPFSWIFRRIKNHNLKKRGQQNVILKQNTGEIQNVDLGDEVSKKCQLNILYFSIIDFNFRTQRPQHLSKHLASLGYDLHYINANFILSEHVNHTLTTENGVNVITLSHKSIARIYDVSDDRNANTLYSQVKEYLLQKEIKDGIIICNYPNWVPVLSALKTEFGFEIIFNFIDDFTGFNTASVDLVRYTNQLFDISKRVIATSDFLYKKATEKHQEVTMIRNGTEYDFFLMADKQLNNHRPIVGYYGAIAEWFNTEIVTFVAHSRPEYDIVLIGDYTYADLSKLSEHKNIKLIGELPYEALPEWLAKFDVCLIPFDASTDLIKATNPVKFYEYLSAGKKIVATEIPELMPYRDQYAYLSNDNKMFLKYVDMCVNGEDDLATHEDRQVFAKAQDWLCRARDLEEVIQEAFEKISIIIVTYNNLSITQMCLNSIFEKTCYPNYELIIVDNASSDDTPAYLKAIAEAHSNVKVILNTENYGFAKGNNIGLAQADGEYLVLLNNDTVVTNGWLTGLTKHLKNDLSLGMIGPVTNSIGNEAQIDIQYPNIESMDMEAKKYTESHFNELFTDINVLAMFCIMMPKHVFEEIGYLDEIYGIGMFEDDDYANALKAQGYTLACAEDVFIHHYGSVSFKKLKDENYRKIFTENKAKYEEKWQKEWIPHKYREGVKP
jgi:GT2 family glycosyltransferase/ubiquinone/menaquinone biosynthesis C-methylase UbiE/predicted  nucleic acid-binding Zn-ribbon protein